MVRIKALSLSMDLGFYPVVLQCAVHSKYFIPLLVPIWRATVTLEQQMLKRPRYCTHNPSLGVIADDLVHALKL